MITLLVLKDLCDVPSVIGRETCAWTKTCFECPFPWGRTLNYDQCFVRKAGVRCYYPVRANLLPASLCMPKTEVVWRCFLKFFEIL